MTPEETSQLTAEIMRALGKALILAASDILREQVRVYTPDESRRIRLAAGISQKRFADMMGVHVMNFRKWENGVAKPQSAAAREKYSRILTELSVFARDEVDK